MLAKGMAAEVGVAMENVMLRVLFHPIMCENFLPPLDEMLAASTSLEESTKDSLLLNLDQYLI